MTDGKYRWMRLRCHSFQGNSTLHRNRGLPLHGLPESIRGGPNYVALVPKGALEVTGGEAKYYIRKGDSGGEARRAFCPDCGTPLWSEPEHLPFIPVKTGALDEGADLKPAMHIYTESAPAWHVIDSTLPCFPRAPDAG